MTVRFKKRRGAILLGELSGRLSFLNGATTAVCSVRPLSLATDEIVGKVTWKYARALPFPPSSPRTYPDFRIFVGKGPE